MPQERMPQARAMAAAWQPRAMAAAWLRGGAHRLDDIAGAGEREGDVGVAHDQERVQPAQVPARGGRVCARERAEAACAHV